MCPVLSVKRHRKYISSQHCSCQFLLPLVLPLACFSSVCDIDVKRNGTFLPSKFAPCVQSYLPAVATANVFFFLPWESHGVKKARNNCMPECVSFWVWLMLGTYWSLGHLNASGLPVWGKSWIEQGISTVLITGELDMHNLRYWSC